MVDLNPNLYLRSAGAIGRRGNPRTVTEIGDQSIPALLAGICFGLGVPVGVGEGAVAPNPNHIDNGLEAIGLPTDPPATDEAGARSMVSLLKGMLRSAGFV